MPKVITVALATGYVTGYTAAFGSDMSANAVAQAAVGALIWLVWGMRH